MEDQEILPGRSCGSCTLCCKLLAVPEVQKPRGVWCQHCTPGSGCGIYDDRPSPCRVFHCGYLTWNMGEHWFPARSKMVVVFEADGNRTVIYVDSSRPNAWREQPYYDEIKRWAKLAAADLKQVIVCVGDRSIVILPDEDVDIGVTSGEERIVIGEIFENGRLKLRAIKMRADDPRLVGAEAGEIYGPSKNPLG